MCPHCEHVSLGYHCEQLSALSREISYMCLNEECNHRFVTLNYIVRTTSLSMIPNPKISIPLSKRIHKYLAAAQLAQQQFKGEQQELNLDVEH